VTPIASVPLLIATTNRGKLAEIRGMLAGLPFDVVALSDLPDIAEPEETGETFEANARQKAVYYAAASGLLTVAEDSGLEIDALDGAPGVHSARWHGSDYAVKFQRIYELLDARGVATSPARFVCALALARGGRVLFEARGTVEGEIAREPRGTHGFGYDPIFYYPPYGCTLGELEDDQKRAVSHRGAAFYQLAAHLAARPQL
jgi:XTP/dITP diphosphohydrolase